MPLLAEQSDSPYAITYDILVGALYALEALAILLQLAFEVF